MKYLSLFSGIGGFELGIQQAYESLPKTKRKKQGRGKEDMSLHGKPFLGTQCIGYSEIDKYAIQIYEKHFPEHKNFGNIADIITATIPDFDLLVGGFPCQSFSIAGKRGGFDDTRGTLFFEIARILEAKHPKLLLLENVKGLLSHNNGNTFKTIVSTLDELGYDLQWQVLNSKDFGVPQNRERIFIVGHLRGTPRPEVFPFGENGQETDELPRQLSNTLTRRYEGAQAVGTYIAESELNEKDDKSDGQNSGQKQAITYSNFKSGRTKTTTHIRRLTPRECERLQGFPDNWTKYGVTSTSLAHPFLISDTQRYKCCGNAVTVNVIQAIMEKLAP